MNIRRLGIVIIGLALLAAAAWLGWRAGRGDDRTAPSSRSLPVTDYAPDPARQRLAPPQMPPAAPETPTPPEPPASGDGITRERVRSEIQKAFETKLPSYKLSDEQYERLTDDVMAIRTSREKMNALPLTAETAREHQRLREQLANAVADFEDVADISLQKFTEMAQPGEGITREETEQR